MYYDESFEPEEIEKQHEELLRIFLEDISHLSDKTIRKHINNVAFFINDYLIYYNGANYEEVNEEIDSFLVISLLENVCGLHQIQQKKQRLVLKNSINQ